MRDDEADMPEPAAAASRRPDDEGQQPKPGRRSARGERDVAGQGAGPGAGPEAAAQAQDAGARMEVAFLRAALAQAEANATAAETALQVARAAALRAEAGLAALRATMARVREGEAHDPAGPERQAFLLRLTDALRPLADPGKVKETASRLLGEQLGVDRAAYAELLPDGQHMATADGYVRPGVPSVAGTYRVTEFGRFFRDVQAGSTGVIDDAEADPSVASYASTWGLLGIRAAIAHPVVKKGRLTAAFYVQSIPPRRWSEADVALVAEVGERTWDAVERARAEAALRESEGRHAFLVRLGDALRPLRDVAGIQAAATRLLGEHLGASRVAYVEVLGGEYVVARDYTDGVPSMAGRYPVASFGPGKLAEYRTGRTRVVHDTAADPHNSASDNASFATVGVRAGIGVPLVKEGVFVANLVVHMDVPRSWTPDEVALVEETADRTWAAVERARAEAAQRGSEERYRTLFETMGQGFALVQLVRDASGRVVDQRYLELNPAFERLLGVPIARASGRLASEVFPGIEPWWSERFDRILAAGRPERIERLFNVTGQWFEVYVYPVGGDRFVALYEDITARKQAEAALQESEARLAAVFEVLPVGVGVFDAHGALLLSNQEMRRFMPTGIMPSRDEARRSRWQARHPDGRPVGPQDFPGARALRGERVVPGIEMLHTDDDGREVWTNASAVPLRNHDGRVTGAAVVVADVDAAKRGAEALRESEARFRQFGECSTDILWIRDAGTLHYEYVSPAFAAIYGTDPGELTAGDGLRGWAEIIHPEDREQALDNLREVRAGGRVSHEFRIRRRPDGEERWIRNTDFPLLDAAGRVQRVAGIGRDVTGRKAADAALRESERRLSTLVDGVPQLVWRSLAGGRWTWCSPQWSAFTGLSEEESRGLGWLAALHPDDRERAMQAWAEADHSAPLQLEARIHSKAEGRHVWFGVRATPLRDERGQAVEWLGTSTDIDALKRLQGQQEVLIAELQHRTRNLLGVVRSVARSSIPPSPERDEYDARLAALGRVQGFLSRSSLYAVPLAHLAQAELVAAAGDGASERVTVGGPSVALPGEGVQTVALALHELATNAVKYGAIAQPSGRLAVTWRVEAGGAGAAGRLVIDWEESGVAMPGGGGLPARRGYGTELITEALPYQLEAKTALVFGHDGVHCRIALPPGAFETSEEARA